MIVTQAVNDSSAAAHGEKSEIVTLSAFTQERVLLKWHTQANIGTGVGRSAQERKEENKSDS